MCAQAPPPPEAVIGDEKLQEPPSVPLALEADATVLIPILRLRWFRRFCHDPWKSGWLLTLGMMYAIIHFEPSLGQTSRIDSRYSVHCNNCHRKPLVILISTLLLASTITEALFQAIRYKCEVLAGESRPTYFLV